MKKMIVTVQNKNTNGIRKIKIDVIEDILLADLIAMTVDIYEYDILGVRL
jgi:hypothetical protein